MKSAVMVVLVGLVMTGLGIVWAGGMQSLLAVLNVMLIMLGVVTIVGGFVGICEEAKHGRR